MMESKRKRIFFVSVIILTFIIPLISSATTVVVNTPPPEKKPSFFETYFGFLLSPIFWGAVLIFIVIILVLVGLFFLIRWIIKFLKSKNDIFFQLRRDRIKLARIHSRYNSKHWYKVHKNTPIRLVNSQGSKINISEPIGWHRGDYTTHEGNVVLSMNLRGNNKWWFIPITDLLMIPNKESVDIIRKKKDNKEEIITINNLPKAEDIIQFNGSEILLHAESVSNVGMFYVPVLKAKNGKIIDLSLPIYQSLKEVVLGDYLYQQTKDFVDIAKRGITMNPNMQYEIKTKDANTNVEVPQQNK